MGEERSARLTNTVASDVRKELTKQTGKGNNGLSVIAEAFETGDHEEEYKEVEE